MYAGTDGYMREEATHKGLLFSREKLAIMVFNDDIEHKSISVLQLEIPRLKEYKNSGVRLNEITRIRMRQERKTERVYN